ncbi:MAG: enoyl-CoA hydratase-related protein [Pseudomonadota bacterium]
MTGPDLPSVAALDLEFDRGWLTIWFNQPEKKNAFTAELVNDLKRVLTSVRDNRSVRGITMRGRGGVFCAGGDLKAFKSQHQSGKTDREDVVAMSKNGAEMFDLVNTMPQVVIVLIEGAAMAGGFGISCCADVVISAADARFAMTETAIGLSPAQISPFVIQKLGYATARRLMLTAARFDGTEAKALGFADIVANTEDALTESEQAIRRQVLACAPGAIADTKALILRLRDLDRNETIKAAAENFADRMLSDEAAEGISAFLEKRKPEWVVE